MFYFFHQSNAIQPLKSNSISSVSTVESRITQVIWSKDDTDVVTNALGLLDWKTFLLRPTSTDERSRSGFLNSQGDGNGDRISVSMRTASYPLLYFSPLYLYSVPLLVDVSTSTYSYTYIYRTVQVLVCVLADVCYSQEWNRKIVYRLTSASFVFQSECNRYGIRIQIQKNQKTL